MRTILLVMPLLLASQGGFASLLSSEGSCGLLGACEGRCAGCPEGACGEECCCAPADPEPSAPKPMPLEAAREGWRLFFAAHTSAPVLRHPAGSEEREGGTASPWSAGFPGRFESASSRRARLGVFRI